MEIYEKELSEVELYWVALLQWLKWRWLWDGLRVIGFLLLMMKVVDEYGATQWGVLGVYVPMWLVVTPFLLLDALGMYILYQSREFPLFRSEVVTVSVYNNLAGFPIGTAFKIMVIVDYESDTKVDASAYW